MRYDPAAMKERLSAQLSDRGTSWSQASLRAKLNRGYVASILKEGKEPTVLNLSKLCEANDLDMAQILFGTAPVLVHGFIVEGA